MNQGASAAANAIILLDIFLYPKKLVYLYFFIPIPAAIMVRSFFSSKLSVKHGCYDVKQKLFDFSGGYFDRC